MRICGAILLLVSFAWADTFTFSDTEFSVGDWSELELRDTASNGTLTVSQGTTIGNPGNYRAGTHAWGPGLVTYAHEYGPAGGASVDPALGAILSIDWGFDGRVFANTAGQDGLVGWFILLEQGGKYFGGPLQVTSLSAGAWVSFAGLGLVATDFLEVSASSSTGDPILIPGSNPDFSTAGDEIMFGFGSYNGAVTVYFTDWGLDNWTITIRTATSSPGPVPEPNAFVLLGAAVAGCAVCRRRRKR